MSTTKSHHGNLLSAFSLMILLVAALLPYGATEAGEEDKKPSAEERQKALEEDVTQGALRVVQEDGTIVECPLRHTDVKAEVAGFIARVEVTQTFYNPTDERIEAVYVFPLPHESAVDEMTMVIGERKIVGVIKRRTEARQIYEAALAAGQTAALLEQERPNIFTQSVGNIDPGQPVNIEIHFVDVLNYDMGSYEFRFPMVVGPRFIPGAPLNVPAPPPPELEGRVSPPVPDTTRVPDASRISPPVLKPGHRNGHDISLSLELDAGVPILGLEAANHEAEIVRKGKRRAAVTLSPADSIPNKDFVLRYHVVGKKPEMAVLGHTGQYTDGRRLGKGFFMLMIQPQEDERLTKSPPREIVFLLDVSGSMSGQPTAKVKEAMGEMLKLCREIDTMQVITFASQTQQLFEKPAPVTKENVAKAVNYTRGIRGGRGTHMLQGVKRAIDQPIDPERVRIVIMLTDGYIGNEAEIIEHVGKSCGDQIRFWAIGIGSSPNMFLVDGVARQGGGMGKSLGLNDTAAGLSEEVITRIQRAQLAKIKIDWGGLDVLETYPAKIPELWAGRPVILFGRYKGGGQGEVHVEGVVEGEAVRWPLKVTLPPQEPGHDMLAKVWARKKIEDLMQQTYYFGSPAVEEEVTAIALDYRLMSQYTSFVAVDAEEAEGLSKERPAQPPRRMLVPVPLPEGTRWEGFFGPLGDRDDGEEMAALMPGFARENQLATNGRGRLASQRSGLARGGMMGGFGGGSYRAGFGGATVPAKGLRPTAAPFPMAGKPIVTARRHLRVAAGEPLRANYALGQQRSFRSLGESMRYGNNWDVRRPATGQMGFLEFAGEEEASTLGLREDLLSSSAYTAQALATDTEPLVKAAQSLLEAGRRHVGKERYDEARHDLVRAYFLATAAINRGNGGAVQTASKALAELDSLHSSRVALWKKEIPPLAEKLRLVLRDMSVGEALDAIAKGTPLRFKLAEGSLEDARGMLAGRDVRVTYLDLRGRTVAEALDWLLQPLRLSWSPVSDRGQIVVGSDRRLAGVSAWVYDVSLIALPTKEDVSGQDDWKKLVAKVKEDGEELTKAIRRTLRASETEVAWFAPGGLLVIGPQRTHENATAMLAELTDPNARPANVRAALHARTSQRATKRRPQLRVLAERQRLLAVASVHDEFGWKLLAAAFDGEVDLEALTELQIAWKADATGKLLDGKGRGLALRSAWTVTTASRMLGDEKELATLATSIRGQIRPAAEKAVSAFQEKPDDITAILPAVYAAMALDDTALGAKVLAALPRETSDNPALTGTIIAARGLLGESLQPDNEQFTKLLTSDGVTGEDVTVLLALACHRAGGETWCAFRAARRDLLGGQPLAGSVVVLVSRLSGNVERLVKR